MAEDGGSAHSKPQPLSRLLLRKANALIFVPLLKLAIISYVMISLISPAYWLAICAAYFAFRLVISKRAHRYLKTIPRDFQGLILLLRIHWTVRKAIRSNAPIHAHLLKAVRAHPNKECVVEVESGRSLTFDEFNRHSNKYANYFQSASYHNGDVVAIFLENGIEFLALWMGLSKLGVVTAWINSNLKLEPLAHSISVSGANTIVTSRSLMPVLLNAIASGALDTKDKKIYLINGDEGGQHPSLASLIKDDTEPSVEQGEGPDFQSVLCYIYTSGTTGNPKAAIIKHYRYFLMGVAAWSAFGIRHTDRLYVTLPMYHSAGGILGVGQILRGCTLVIRTRFSASNFWRDAVKHNCTVSQYIGEICRYLLAQKADTDEEGAEAHHKIRLMYGNGLRPEIWRQFVQRFRIERIGELYGSTEGNSNILNIDNHEGACGFMPIYECLNDIYPVRLIKVDPETGELVRDANGICVSCRPGETGEMVGAIKERDILLRFEGYVGDAAQTQKKVIRDVMHKGDMSFSSGDILYWDELGYLYFRDRRGDTYRWKGENVSTTEVEAVIQPMMVVLDATVYGVEVPGREGRAGMIAISLATQGVEKNTEDFLDELSRRVSDNLASYAIPCFLRICRHVETTGTFKLKKAHLQREGYDPSACSGDPLFFWDASLKRYSPLTKQMYAEINSGVYTKI